ncbi:MAG: hypothetical protein CXT73_07410 [Methanobacteriota archaeon]|nr:MAG: hypothetical protein CXT73_07410 [Euryarchaeota archaeon]
MAARAAAIPNANPGGVPYLLPLPPLGPYGVPDLVTDALANQLNQPGAVTPYAAPAGPIAARANLAALGLNPAGPQPAAVPVGTPGGTDAWQLAIQNAELGANYIQNSNYVAGKANEFREVAVIRLREIYGRLLSIGAQAALIGPAAAAAAQAQAALVDLINAVNAQGYIDPQQAQAMADLAEQLQHVDIPQMMAGLIGEINSIAQAVGVVVGNTDPGDTGPVPLQGGRKKKAKKTRRKKHKGGYKFTRAAISRRSLRQSRRKSLSGKHKKRKRTKKHRKRRRRRRR